MFKALNHFIVLLWKCYLLRRHHYVSAICEFTFPVVLMYMSLVILSLKKDDMVKSPNNTAQQSVSTPLFRESRIFKNDIIILFYPNNKNTLSYINDVKYTLDSYNYSNEIMDVKFKDEKSLENYYLNASQTNLMDFNIFGIIFEEFSKDVVRYKIRSRMDAFTTRLFSIDDGVISIYKKFLWIQAAVDLSILKKYSNTFSSLDIELCTFPFPAYKETNDSFHLFLIWLSYVFGFLLSYLLIVKRIADEKQNGMHELFKIIGISDCIYWLSSFISFFLFYIVQSAIVTSLFFIKFSNFLLFQYSNAFLVYIGLLLYGAELILSAILISIPFKKPVLAICVAFVYYLIQIIPGASITKGITSSPSLNLAGIFFVFLMPNTSAVFLFRFIFLTESFSIGTKWENIFDVYTIYGKFSYFHVCLSMFASCFLYCILIWYFETSCSRQYGNKFFQKVKPLCFCIFDWFRSYEKEDMKQDFSYLNNPLFEMDDTPYTEGIMIRNLTKKFFAMKNKAVVDDLCLDVRKGHITVLLGHNGAGKTTTMNIITGLTFPTKGTVLINGYNVRTHKGKARRNISFCPQHNVIYNELTIRQHLKLFGLIKNTSIKQINELVTTTAKMLNLTDSLDKMASSLSGGQQRRLCLGMSIIGNTNVLILDEPTSGLDPETRRDIWNALLKIRLNKTVLLTTHFLDEADALGDKVAIMASGRLICFGTPLFLKRELGTGYQLRITKTPRFNHELLNVNIRNYFPNAELFGDSEKEIIYSLNNLNESKNSSDYSVFASFFDIIEKCKDNFGISGWGLSMTTLQDVFLKVEHIHSEKKDLSEIEVKDDTITSPITKLTGYELHYQILKGLLYKRFYYTKRNWIMFLIQITFPMITFILLLIYTNFLYKNPKPIPLKLNTEELYGKTIGLYEIRINESNIEESHFEKSLKRALENNAMQPVKIDKNSDINTYLTKESEKIDIISYINKYIIAIKIKNYFSFEVWYNEKAIHAQPLGINLVFEALIINFTSNSLFRIRTTNHRFPYKYRISQYEYFKSAAKVVWLLSIKVPFLFLASSYTLFPTYEKYIKAKLLQMMTGLSPVIYWISNFIFDMFTHIIVIVLIIVGIMIFDSFSLISNNFLLLVALCIILLIFGFSTISLAYLTSLLFKRPSSAFIFLMTVYFSFFMIYSIFIEIIYQMGILQHNNSTIQSSRFFPINAMTSSVMNIISAVLERFYCKHVELNCDDHTDPFTIKCCKNACKDNCYEVKNPFKLEFPEINYSCLIMFLEGILVFLIIFAYEYGFRSLIIKIFQFQENCVKNSVNASNDDPDVITEKQNVELIIQSRKIKDVALVVNNLSKRFQKFQAVKPINFLIHHNECFGLLGVNGAGKTTTFRMLVGEILPSSGNAYLGAYDLLKNLKKFQKHIGYCPQFDALLEDLTGEQILFLFARLRGIPENQIQSEVIQLIDMADLQSHCKKPIKHCSGGCKRKFSLVSSIIGNPDILFLDEPTTGVDPSGRKKIWSLLDFFRQKRNVSIMLTSHSMDECEALCSRIAIMESGKLQCIGTLQQLRDKYGKEFYLFIKVKQTNEKYLTNLINHITTVFPSAILRNKYQKNLEFSITDKSLYWSFLFSEMQKVKIKFQLEDYILTDTSLEQIFLSFARRASQDA